MAFVCSFTTTTHCFHCSDYWEKKPLVIRRHAKSPRYYADLFSGAAFDTMLRRNYLKYTVNVDVTSYVDGVRSCVCVCVLCYKPGCVFTFTLPGRSTHRAGRRPTTCGATSGTAARYAC